jgi:hypothetical protein
MFIIYYLILLLPDSLLFRPIYEEGAAERTTGVGISLPLLKSEFRNIPTILYLMKIILCSRQNRLTFVLL